MKRPIPFLSEALAILALARFALRKADRRAQRRALNPNAEPEPPCPPTTMP